MVNNRFPMLRYSRRSKNPGAESAGQDLRRRSTGSSRRDHEIDGIRQLIRAQGKSDTSDLNGGTTGVYLQHRIWDILHGVAWRGKISLISPKRTKMRSGRFLQRLFLFFPFTLPGIEKHLTKLKIMDSS